MGLGGHITWTPLVREHAKLGKKTYFYKNGINNCIYDEIFSRNPCITNNVSKGVPVNMGLDSCIYLDVVGNRAVYKPKYHIAERILNVFGFKGSDIKPDIFFNENDVLDKIPSNKYLVIEPYSKTSFTPNKKYSFEKWQYVVNKLHKDIDFVQVGEVGNRELDNVISVVGKTTFMQAGWLISKSKGLVSTEGGLVHMATGLNIKALAVFTGFLPKYVAEYKQNITVDISTHDTYCGLLTPCEHCKQDVIDHDPEEIVQKIVEEML